MSKREITLATTSKVLLLVFSCVFTHLQITTVSGVPFTIPYFTVGPIIILALINARIRFRWLILFFVIISLPALMLLPQLTTFEFANFDALRYWKSYLLYAFAVVFAVAMLSDSESYVSERILSAACITLSVPCVYLFLQVIEFNLLGQFNLLHPFAEFTRVGPGGVPFEPYFASPIKKVAGTLSEPSAGAWFSASCFVFSSYLNGVRYSTFLRYTSAVGMLATLSISGAINFLVLSTVGYITLKRSSLEAGAVAKKYIEIIVILSLGVALLGGLGFYEHTIGRVERVLDGGHSLYYRLVAPVYLVTDIINTHPFGVPLGDISFISSKAYMHNTEFGSETNLDSFWVWMSVHFGVLGLLTAVGILIRGFHLVFVRKSEGALIIVFVILLFTEAGSITNPSTIVVALLPLLSLSGRPRGNQSSVYSYEA